MAKYVVTFVVERAGELLIKEARFTCGVRDQLEELQAEPRRMRCFLKDADGRQEESETLQNLVIEIRQVAHDAEDVLEFFAFKASSRRRRRGIRNVFLRFACIFNKGIAVYMVGSKIDNIKIKISKLTASLQGYGVRAVTEGGEGPSSSHERLNQLRRSYSHVSKRILWDLMKTSRYWLRNWSINTQINELFPYVAWGFGKDHSC
ncbi:hypothetical protein LguiA_001976 [Lonicera macranthoides]